jgi:hypothetical protein
MNWDIFQQHILGIGHMTKGAFTPDVKSVFNENLGGILGGTQC